MSKKKVIITIALVFLIAIAIYIFFFRRKTNPVTTADVSNLNSGNATVTVPSTTGTPVTTTVDPNKMVYFGENSPEVKYIQGLLNKHLGASLVADGNLGQNTEKELTKIKAYLPTTSGIVMSKIQTHLISNWY